MGKTIKKSVMFCVGVVYFLHLNVIVAMDPVNKRVLSGAPKPVLPVLQSSILPHKVIDLWSSERALSKGVSLCNQVPGTLFITPDEKAVITAHNGQVFYCNFFDGKGKQLLFELPQITHSPMITMAQKKEDLLVVGAGNYVDKERDIRVGECQSFCAGFSRVRKLSWPVQQIMLNSAATLLAVAGEKNVEVIDLETDNSDTFYFRDNNFGRITDIVMSPHSEFLLVATSEGVVNLMSLDTVKESVGVSVSRLQKFLTGDYIKKIYWPTLDELLYIADNSEVKCFETRDLVEPFREATDYRKQLICVPVDAISFRFSFSEVYDMATADTGGKVATAHWTNSNRLSEDISHVIETYRKSHKYIEKVSLKVPTLVAKRYDYTTSLGQIHSAINHLWMVAMRNNCVVALRSNGQLLVWSIVKKQLHKRDSAKRRSISDNEVIDTKQQSTKKGSISSRRRGSQPPAYHQVATASPRNDSIVRAREVATSEPVLQKPKPKTTTKRVTSYSPRRSRDTSPASLGQEKIVRASLIHSLLEEDISTDNFVQQVSVLQPQLDTFGRASMFDAVNDSNRENKTQEKK